MFSVKQQFNNVRTNKTHTTSDQNFHVSNLLFSYLGTTILPFFPFTGMLRAKPSALATLTPTRVPVNEPGPVSTSISSISLKLFLFFFKILIIKGKSI